MMLENAHLDAPCHELFLFLQLDSKRLCQEREGLANSSYPGCCGSGVIPFVSASLTQCKYMHSGFTYTYPLALLQNDLLLFLSRPWGISSHFLVTHYILCLIILNYTTHEFS